MMRWFLFGILLGALAVIAGPMFVKARSSSPNFSCRGNLMQIEGAKHVWAMESRKCIGDAVEARDLYGTDRYIREEPECYQGGNYLIGLVGSEPKCSVGGEGHALTYRPPPTWADLYACFYYGLFDGFHKEGSPLRLFRKEKSHRKPDGLEPEIHVRWSILMPLMH